MANNIVYANDGSYGEFREGEVGALMQGQTGVVATFTLKDLEGNAIDLSGYTVTGKLKNRNTAVVASITGATAVTGSAASGEFSWTTHADDVAEDGPYWLWFTFVKASNPTYISHPTPLDIADDESVNGTFVAAGGVTVAMAEWLEAASSVAATTNNIVVWDANDELADGGATIASLIPDSIMDAKGDLLTATAADTPARLAVGADGRFLKANSAEATGLEWAALAGGGDLLAANNLSDVASSQTSRTNLGLGTGNSPQFTAVNIGHATDTTIARTGAGDISVEGNAIYRAGGTDVPVTDGGTGASTAADARTNLGLVIGTNVQAQDAELTAIAALAVTDGNIIVGDGATWVAESGATARTSLGLGTGNSPQFTAVNVGSADTTLARVSAGVLSVEGVTILTVAGGTLTGEIVAADQLITRPVLKDVGEAVNALGDLGGGTDNIDLTLGNVVTLTVSTSTQTFTFSNWPASGTAGSVTIIGTNMGSQTVNWPAAVKWAGNTEPTLTSSGVDILTFVSTDAGTTIYGFAAGLNMS